MRSIHGCWTGDTLELRNDNFVLSDHISMKICEKREALQNAWSGRGRWEWYKMRDLEMMRTANAISHLCSWKKFKKLVKPQRKRWGRDHITKAFCLKKRNSMNEPLVCPEQIRSYWFQECQSPQQISHTLRPLSLMRELVCSIVNGFYKRNQFALLTYKWK